MRRGTMKRFLIIAMGLACWTGMELGAGLLAFGYEETAVTDGGILTGKVTLDGAIPEPRIFPLALYPFGPFCGKNTAITDGRGNVRISEFIVAPDHGMKDVVVAVQDVQKGKPFPPIATNLVAQDVSSFRLSASCKAPAPSP